MKFKFNAEEGEVFALDAFDLNIGKPVKFFPDGQEAFLEESYVLTSADVSQDGRSVVLTFEDNTPREERQLFGSFGPYSIDPDFQEGKNG